MVQLIHPFLRTRVSLQSEPTQERAEVQMIERQPDLLQYDRRQRVPFR